MATVIFGIACVECETLEKINSDKRLYRFELTDGLTHVELLSPELAKAIALSSQLKIEGQE